MVDVLSSRRHDGFPSKFKRPRVSAVREYPRDCGMSVPKRGREEIANFQVAAADRIVLRKHPPSKFRKGVPVMRDFPVLMNAPAASTNQLPSDFKDSHSAYGMPMVDCRLSDASNATNVHVCTEAKQDNLSFVTDSKLFYVPNATNVCDIHACIEPKQDSVLMGVNDCKPMDISIANNAYVCNGVKESSLSIVVMDEQCEVNISTATNACMDVKESSPSLVVGVEQCQDVLDGVDDFEVVRNDERRDTLTSIAKQAILSMVVSDEHTNLLFEVYDSQAAFSDEEYEKALLEVNDSQATFSHEECGKALLEVNNSQAAFSDEECEKALLEANNSQEVSDDLVVTNNKARDKVKEVIHLFREVHRQLSQHSEPKPKGNSIFKAASLLQSQKKCINVDKRLGPIPGVEVGDYFDWRAELSIIGLHRQFMCGIDYIELDGRILAVSIVDSGRYDNVVESNDEQEFPDVLIYSGQGENLKLGSGKLVGDQKLVGGNLALKNSGEAKTPIRVIRKFSFKSPSRRKIVDRKFVYDGLYFVDNYREEIATIGKLVFKFVLKRFPGQPKLDWAKLVRKENVCMNDISQGKERIPIRAMNALDDEKPPFFNYVTNVIYPKSHHPSVLSDGCDCSDGCSDSEDCPCTTKNGGEIPYNYEECIMKAKPLLIECGPSCKCFTSCLNRVSQRGIRFPLEVFKTETKGWGVRSQSFIPRGSFICEYIGEILRDKEVEQMVGTDEYLFDIGNNYGNHSLQETSTLFGAPSHSSEVNECFTIDAARFGNVGRFINHSCSPNLFAQNVLFDHNNKSMPHIMLFAMKDIPPLKELTYDYNYTIGEVCDANGNVKVKTCHCGSRECTGRMY